ncbi:MAG: hypothetical protein AB7I33_01825 [Gemmatimonadales bacterium]
MVPHPTPSGTDCKLPRAIGASRTTRLLGLLMLLGLAGCGRSPTRPGQTAVVSVVWADSAPIQLVMPGTPLRVMCNVVDANGRFVSDTPGVQSRQGVIQGTTCAALTATRSGFDTLEVTADDVTTTVPVVVALPPAVSPALGRPLPADSVPAGMQPWAPTLIRGPAGSLDLYFTGYLPDAGSPTGLRGDLHRFTSTDGGASFQYDGAALLRDPIPCSLNGDGIENVAVVPRSDAPGWRMYYAAGGFTCYGWQVFSAVSDDMRTWVKESGVRISNGGPLPPAAPGGVPWPSGEGMVVDQLPGGEFRMIVGAYRHEMPFEDKFQITDWRSDDQLAWHYVGTLLSTDDVGPDAQRSIYSPTISEVVPGLYRMIFTGDDLNVGGHSRLYSAVSLDRTSWQVEGVLMTGDATGTDIFYSTVVDSLLVFIRRDPGQVRYLATATVTMP